jgi:hypothetical protein
MTSVNDEASLELGTIDTFEEKKVQIAQYKASRATKIYKLTFFQTLANQKFTIVRFIKFRIR